MSSNPDQGPIGGVMPHLTTGEKRAKESIAFYKAAFGTEEATAPHIADDGEGVLHAHLRINGGSIMLNDDFPEYGGAAGKRAAVTIHLLVDDADRWFTGALNAGATETMPLADTSSGAIATAS